MKHIIMIICAALSFSLAGQEKQSCNTHRKENIELQLDSIFKDNPGTFVLYDLQNDNYQVYNEKLAKEAFPVHSTSKILWSIIGLEENLIAGGEALVKWDSVKYPGKEWWPAKWKNDQSVVTALRNSVNWYYSGLLDSMAPAMIEDYLNKLNYQKGFKVDVIHYFGLTYQIRKSAFDQVDFLKHLYLNDFGISEKTYQIIQEGMFREQGNDYALYCKTGTGPIPNDSGIGWLVGYVIKGQKVYFFAFHVENPDESMAGKLRSDYSFRILRALGYID